MRNLIHAIIRAIFGHEFTCWHMDSGGAVKVFHCKTLAEAMAWIPCALNDSSALVVDRQGYLVLERYPVRVQDHELEIRRWKKSQ